VHTVADEQDTAFSSRLLPPVGVGVLSMVQVALRTLAANEKKEPEALSS
jgi:hypothetical protein